MSRVGTVREGLRDNPLRLALFIRTTLVVLFGLLLVYTFAPNVIWAATHFQSPSPKSLAFLAAVLAGLVAEFTSIRFARVFNPALYFAYVVEIALVPWEFPVFNLLWSGLCALFTVVVALLYCATSPSLLAATDAA